MNKLALSEYSLSVPKIALWEDLVYKLILVTFIRQRYNWSLQLQNHSQDGFKSGCMHHNLPLFSKGQLRIFPYLKQTRFRLRRSQFNIWVSGLATRKKNRRHLHIFLIPLNQRLSALNQIANNANKDWKHFCRERTIFLQGMCH